ncbi:MAG: 4-hydroxybenzoate octaprenyltransferase [Planctomycetes bacterium]|nr:4-hydroxybenzoate octaprenyltransferase [Planctomycetota bacterium]
MPTHSSQRTAPAAPGRLRTAAADIKLAHSVFALPFAVLAVFLALPPDEPMPRLVGKLALVVVCMVFARTWAMLVNRIADRRLDALNPRTQARAIPSGRLSTRDAVGVALGSAALFTACASLFWILFDNPWPTILAVPVLAWIAAYSYTKRFTVLCHVFLGGALAASPLAAALAVNPGALAHTPALWLIAAMVLAWVAGFDVIYALQDLDFDRGHRVRSIPASLGAGGAIWISRALHLTALAALLAAWRVEDRFGPLFALGVAIVAALLLIEHAVLHVRGREGISMAFFTLNGIVSCVLGVLGVTDLLLG